MDGNLRGGRVRVVSQSMTEYMCEGDLNRMVRIQEVEIKVEDFWYLGST